MNTRILIAIVCLVCLGMVEVPDWVKNQGRSARYPEISHLTGFGMDKARNSEDRAASLQRAQDNARSYLVQRIRVRIQSTLGSFTEERDQKVASLISNAVVATSSMELQGLDVQTYYDDGEDMSYALAYASREKLVQIYEEREAKLGGEIRAHLQSGMQLEKDGERTKALEEYVACYPLFQMLEEAQAIVVAAKNGSAQAIDGLQAQATKDQVALEDVRSSVQRLLQRPLETVDDVAWHLAYCLKEQMTQKDIRVIVASPTYGDTKMGSPFSRYFKQVLETKLSEVAKWTPVQQTALDQPQTRNLVREAAEVSGAKYVLRGSYWEQQGGIKFIVSLSSVSDGKLIAGVESIVADSVVREAGLSLKPQNFKAALSDQKQFAADEVVGGGLSIEVWTNKGADDLIFTKGERLNVYVRVNMPCYIQFIYHLADGRRALLVDNYYIDQSKVNIVYQIPEEFECDEPYGAEFLQVFARTEKFDPVETQRVDGYDILKEDLGQFLATQRGMKKVKQGTLQAETRLVMTTMEK